MKSFQIYEHPVLKQIRAIKVGWSWLGFFFPIIYGAIKKNWKIILIAVIGQPVLGFVIFLLGVTLNGGNAESATTGAVIWSNIFISIFTGLKFNSYLAGSLVKDGFIPKDIIPAMNENVALVQWQKD